MSGENRTWCNSVPGAIVYQGTDNRVLTNVRSNFPVLLMVFRAPSFPRSQLRYFSRAVKDFSEVVKSSVDSRTDWNMIALCRGQLGEPEAAEEAYRRALAIDPSFKVRASTATAHRPLSLCVSVVFRSTTSWETNRTCDFDTSLAVQYVPVYILWRVICSIFDYVIICAQDGR